MNFMRTVIGFRFRILLVAVFFAAVAVTATAHAWTSTQENSPNTQPELKVTLSTWNLTRCLGSTMTLELQIENIGRTPITVNVPDLWSKFSFSYRGLGTEGREPLRIGGRDRSETPGSAGSSRYREIVRVEPGTTQSASFEFVFGNAFFNEAGKYTIATTVQLNIGLDQNYEIDSNQVEFELFDCGNRPENEEQP